MASLTHVCMWSENGWIHVTADQAAKIHPGGTVSARSGLFRCELCHQYVTFTDGDIRMRYFKHSAYEKSKDCPERTFGSNYLGICNAKEHALPIRITGITTSSFRFEIGLIRVPMALLEKNCRIEIKPNGMSDTSFVFSKERLNPDSITYLPIGNRPFEKYTLNIQNAKKRLYDFWPEEIQGIDPEGTLFERSSGKKLVYDADVEVGKKYYLLKRGIEIISKRLPDSIQIQKVLKKQFDDWETWTLYEVSATKMEEAAAQFFFDLHCRLTDCPVSLQPVWPLFVESNYMFKHNQVRIYILVKGDKDDTEVLRTFPDAPVLKLDSNGSQNKLYKMVCSDRQQLISVGRYHALQYTYFWKEPLNRVGIHPDIWVTDLAGETIPPGETDRLPWNKMLRLKSTFDGEAVVFRNNRITDKRKVSADEQIELEGLAYGMSVQVVIGLDIVWQVNFRKRQPVAAKDERELFKQICNASGAQIPAPHSLRNMMTGMKRYPEISQWIGKCLRNGTIYEQAYRRLQEAYRSMKINDKEKHDEFH